MATLEAPPADEALAIPQEEDAPAVAEAEAAAPPPEVIRVPARRPRPIMYAAVGVPLLIASFVGSMFFARGQVVPVAPAHAEWSYEGEHGPSHWGEDRSAAACLNGTEQSPINLTAAREMQVDWLSPIELRYKPSKARLLNNGHTFQVNYDKGSRLVFLGNEYELAQFHFHLPSEHQVNSQAAAMELHLVHQATDGSGRLAVVGVLIQEGPDSRSSRFFDSFWKEMPQKPKEGEKPKEKALNLEINPIEAVPQNRSYYTYNGSLTTPPCTEGVKWIVLKEAITATRDQIRAFETMFKMNARPIQDIKDRFIMEQAPPPAR
jgi:carbonic anhydrase